MRKKFKFPLVWLWALVPMLPVFYYALKPAESKRPKVGEVRGGLVYGEDGDWHSPEPAWVQAIKEAQPGTRLTVHRDWVVKHRVNGRSLEIFFYEGDEVIVDARSGDELLVHHEGSDRSFWLPFSVFLER